MSLSYSGQCEFLERANARLKLVVPATLAIIFVLLYLCFARLGEALLIMATLPFALVGGAGLSTCSATTCRSPRGWASSPWPGWPPSSA